MEIPKLLGVEIVGFLGGLEFAWVLCAVVALNSIVLIFFLGAEAGCWPLGVRTARAAATLAARRLLPGHLRAHVERQHLRQVPVSTAQPAC